jgi:alpha-glucuronidase
MKPRAATSIGHGLFLLVFFCTIRSHAEDGYRLWLRYDRIGNAGLLQEYRNTISSCQVSDHDPVLKVAGEELITGVQGLLDIAVARVDAALAVVPEGCITAGTPSSSAAIRRLHLEQRLAALGDEGFLIVSIQGKGRQGIAIAANTGAGVLYGVFHFLRLLQTQQDIRQLAISSSPVNKYRILDHWDSPNRWVERGYAGISLWNWQTLPLYLDRRYTDYARANASIGINGTVLNSVNANAIFLTKDWVEKVAALANTFRPYGIKVYLSAKFSSPIEIGGLKTADPLDPAVRQWWKKTVDDIYDQIPDFGGFLVKANSEGQPGPQDYGRTHADGANMFADALAPHHGIVMWRAFVYSETNEDRFKQAYDEFKPLDGKFRDNVLLQVKNGPIDFQPREPFHPLFGAMPGTPLLMEFQLTQEYLGFATHLVFLAPLFEECLDADTYDKGKGSPVSSTITGMTAVANIGNDRNWCGHPFAQANWYAFGRLAWSAGKSSPQRLSSAQIADEWIRQTFSNDSGFVGTVKKMMLASREIMVDYMTPLGLHHIMGYGHHYGPAPWYDKASRADWNPVYFHRADSAGIGFDRTAAGSNALAQYNPDAARLWKDEATCPDQWLLWFHHVSWRKRLSSGRTLWDELCFKYYTGVDSVHWMQKAWEDMRHHIDAERWDQVRMLLSIQENEAVWWRNACLLYFQTFSNMPLPAGYAGSDHTLAYYEALRFPFAPGSASGGR